MKRARGRVTGEKERKGRKRKERKDNMAGEEGKRSEEVRCL